MGDGFWLSELFIVLSLLKRDWSVGLILAFWAVHCIVSLFSSLLKGD